MRRWLKVLSVSSLLPAMWGTSCQAMELKVFSDGPLRMALTQIVTEFRAQTGHAVEVLYGTAPALKGKLASGEKADILISLSSEIVELKEAGQLSATQDNVANIKLALAIRKGAAVPEIRTLDAFKRTLLQADAIIHNDLASGRAFARQLERIGIAEQVRPKIVLVKGNGQLEELAKRSGNDVAGGTSTQIIADKTIGFVGTLPPEAQSEIVYSAGVFTSTQSLDAARAFVAFLGSPMATNIFVAAGAK